MKCALNKFISRLDKAKERITKPEDRSIKASQTKTQREKNMKTKRTFKNQGTISKWVTCN